MALDVYCESAKHQSRLEYLAWQSHVSACGPVRVSFLICVKFPQKTTKGIAMKFGFDLSVVKNMWNVY